MPKSAHKVAAARKRAPVLPTGIPLNARVIDHVSRPPGLIGRADVFALRVHGDCMAPAFGPGDLAFIEPLVPPTPGDFVVIDFGDGERYIKQLVRISRKAVILRMFNPKLEFPIELRDIRRLWRVFSESDLAGA